MANYKYIKLADLLKNDIHSAHFAPGAQIPTEDELMERYSLGRNTVRQAMNVLANEGYLIKIPGSGTFVAKNIGTSTGKNANRNSRKCIGVVLNHVDSYIFPRLLMGISDYLVENDYVMTIRLTFNQIAKEKQVLSEFLSSDLAGIILEPACSGLPPVNGELYKKIRETVPCVLVHANLPGFSFPSVTVDDAKGYEMLVDHLIAKGHRNIALLAKLDEDVGHKRFLGYANGLQKHGMEIDERQTLWFTTDQEDDLFSDANAHRILKFIDQCTAVMCFNDDIACRFYSFLERHSIRVPDNLSLVGYDDLVQDRNMVPLTTIVHPKEVLGRGAAKAILDLIANPASDVTICYEPQLIERKSTKNLLSAPIPAFSDTTR